MVRGIFNNAPVLLPSFVGDKLSAIERSFKPGDVRRVFEIEICARMVENWGTAEKGGRERSGKVEKNKRAAKN